MVVVLRVDPFRPDPTIVDMAAERLRSGDLVAFPTESFYGLGGLAMVPEAVGRLFRVKHRAPNQPILVMVADRRQLDSVVESVPPLAERLIHRFWPGPLTLVLRARETVPPALTAGTGCLGVRQPGLAVSLRLTAAAGAPVTATSANRSGAAPPTTAEMVNATLGAEIDLILDGGPTIGGLPSTVLDMTSDPPLLIRPGRITVEQLRGLCGIVWTRNPAQG